MTRPGAPPHAARAVRQRASARAGVATALALGTVALQGCSHGSANLAGHWRGVRSEGVRSDVADTTNAYAAHLQIDVKGDVITLVTAKDSRADHYTVVQEDKARTVITTDMDGESDPQTFTFAPDAKTMKWAVSPGSSIVFTKE